MSSSQVTSQGGTRKPAVHNNRTFSKLPPMQFILLNMYVKIRGKGSVLCFSTTVHAFRAIDTCARVLASLAHAPRGSPVCTPACCPYEGVA
jgi:hypothetical protein